MIRYQLQCRDEHGFEAWFNSAAAFDAQAAAHEIACPFCGSVDVRKAMMAPNISLRTKTGGNDASPDQVSENSAADSGTVAAAAGSQMETDVNPVGNAMAVHKEFVEVVRKMRREVEKSADYVGPRFAEEARRIHHEESEPRGIYGEASGEEVAELSEEGIEFHALPRLPEDNN